MGQKMGETEKLLKFYTSLSEFYKDESDHFTASDHLNTNIQNLQRDLSIEAVSDYPKLIQDVTELLSNSDWDVNFKLFFIKVVCDASDGKITHGDFQLVEKEIPGNLLQHLFVLVEFLDNDTSQISQFLRKFVFILFEDLPQVIAEKQKNSGLEEWDAPKQNQMNSFSWWNHIFYPCLSCVSHLIIVFLIALLGLVGLTSLTSNPPQRNY